MKKETRDHRLAKCLLMLLLLGSVGLVADGTRSFFRSAAQTKPAPPEYTQQISQNYDLKFGANPFAPSNASSTTGTFIPGEMWVPAKRCGSCHTDAHAQWRQSAHGNAFKEPFYQKNVKDLTSQKGIEYTRHCESCHNPAALFTGALTKNSHVKRPFDD